MYACTQDVRVAGKGVHAQEGGIGGCVLRQEGA